MFHEYFEIYVGIVCGCDNVFKNNKLGNIDVINAENSMEKYPSTNKQINDYLLTKKNIKRLKNTKNCIYGKNKLFCMLKPKINCNEEMMKKVITYLNSDEFKEKFIYNGRFKIGHRQLFYSYIPNSIIV